MISSVLAMAMVQSVGTMTHTFTFTSPRTDITTVSLVGTFNNWNADAALMQRTDQGWQIRLSLAPGRYAYKFVVNKREWIPDPAARHEDDGVGNINSVLLILPYGYDKPARTGDGSVTASAISHMPEAPDLNADQGELTFRVRVRPEDIERAEVRLWTTGRSSLVKSIPLASMARDEVYDTLAARVNWDQKTPYDYDFVFREGGKSFCYGPEGLKESDGARFSVSAERGQFPVVPDWVQGSIFYQIFPDRFDNGDAANDPKDVAPWTSKPEWFNHFGGDTAGVRKRIGYLANLGVNAVYFNPVMVAPSNHRYDPCDFFKIDPEFGTNEEYAAMTRALQAKGIRTVQDQIFDHIGVEFPQFKDLLKNQQASKYKDWFFVKKWPVKVERNPNYEAWFNAEAMPKINVLHPDVKAMYWKSLDYWMNKAAISGWRLDVANEVPMEFWREFRSVLKKKNPDAWIVGEVWGQASGWLKGDQWDASMNYPFRDAMIKFIAKETVSPTQAQNQLFETYNWYAPQVSRNQMNLLSSHDTARFLTDAGGDQRKQLLAAAVQMTWVGSPSIYYGEEIGLEGGPDPDNRRPMEWNRATEDNPVLREYRKLIGIRRTYPVLALGAPVRTQCFDAKGVMTFGRRYRDSAVLVAVNRTKSAQNVTVNVAALGDFRMLKDALSGQVIRVDRSARTVQLDLPPQSAVVALSPPEATRFITLDRREQSRRSGTHTENPS